MWYKYDFMIKENGITQPGISDTTTEYKKHLYKTYLDTHVEIKPKDVHKIHKEILKALAQNYIINQKSKVAVREKEQRYKSNIINHIKTILDSISTYIYKAAMKGNVFCNISFDCSSYTITCEHNTEIDLKNPTSDDKIMSYANMLYIY